MTDEPTPRDESGGNHDDKREEGGRKPPRTDPLIMVHTTCGDRDEAERLAGEMVEERLAACASVGQPVTSVYPWEGAIERDAEISLTLKTTSARFDALSRRLTERHSYDVPELLAVEVVNGNADYTQWVRDWVAG